MNEIEPVFVWDMFLPDYDPWDMVYRCGQTVVWETSRCTALVENMTIIGL